MANRIDRKIKYMILHREEPQPRPIFFSAEQIKRMNQAEGSYQYKGGSNGEKTNPQ